MPTDHIDKPFWVLSDWWNLSACGRDEESAWIALYVYLHNCESRSYIRREITKGTLRCVMVVVISCENSTTVRDYIVFGNTYVGAAVIGEVVWCGVCTVRASSPTCRPPYLNFLLGSITPLLAISLRHPCVLSAPSPPLT